MRLSTNNSFLISLLTIVCINISFSQNQKGHFRLNPTSDHQFYVVFDNTIELNDNTDIIAVVPDLKAIIEQYNIQLEPGIKLSSVKKKMLDRNKHAQNKKGVSNGSKLNNIFIVKTTTQDKTFLLEIANRLEGLPEVKYCHFTSTKLAPPPSFSSDDIPPTTPDFIKNQTYIGANPGVNMQYAWDRGYTGSGISIGDVEYGFEPTHEDLAKTNAKLADGMTINSLLPGSYLYHGTSVAGVVFAGNNGFGVTGLAHGANQYVVYPEYTEEKDYDRVYAVTKALENAKKGDVVIYEMQASGESETVYVPAEFDKIVWELTKSATNLGITVVAAAGNGNANLDTEFYKSYRDLGDSGAIIVGGGTPDLNHNKNTTSTYGSRVNIQAWGSNIWTTGILDRPNCPQEIFGNDNNQTYTPCFGGTSGATPIVASCAAVLQSYYLAQTQNYLTSLQIRDILVSTGIPQGTGGHIGPLPNMKAAMEKIDADFLLSTPKESYDANFIISPNPVDELLNIRLPNYFKDNAVVEIFNSIGQLLDSKKGFIGSNTIDISYLQSGVYIIKVTDGTLSATKRIFKN